MHNNASTDWVKRVVALQTKTPDYLVCDKHADREKLAHDWLDEKRDRDRLDLMQRLIPENLSGTHVLEVGSGVGTFVLAASRIGIRMDGIEPVQELVNLSKERIASEGFQSSIVCGEGERLPYSDNMFDSVVSFNVLEHVTDPGKVLDESLRVVKPGGYIFFSIPNYNSFWEGHYGIFWVPSIHRIPILMNLYIRLMGRNPDYAKTLQFITPKLLRSLLLRSSYKNTVSTMGYEIWNERLYKKMPAWGYTAKLLQVVRIARALKLLGFVAFLGKIFEFYTPITLVIRKDT